MTIGPVARVSAPSEPLLATNREPAPTRPPAPNREFAPAAALPGDNPDGVPRAEAAAPASGVERRVTIDPQTRQVVSATLDRDTGEVVRQVPDEALRRLQIYARAMRQVGASAPANGRLGIEA